MKKTLLFFLITLFNYSVMQSQTMTFDSGASETGFSFNGWTGTGAIYMSNLSNPSTITKNSGTWNIVSFYVGPFTGNNDMQVTSNLGNSYNYNTNSAGTHTLNWAGITTLTFTRISGGGASADYDNIVYTVNLSLEDNQFNNSVKIYPNPSTEFIEISNLLFEVNYSIYNVLGMEISKGKINSNERINVENLQKGTYFLKLENEQTFSFIKK